MALVMKSICLVVIAAHSFRGTYATQLAGSPYVNACAYVECQNGGRCYTVGGDAAVCSCPLGFTGQSCEVKEDPCLHYQCENGGTCQSRNGYPECICPLGFTGFSCTFKEDPCLRYQCYNGGYCQSQEDNPVCDCPPGFTGKQCNSTIINYNADPYYMYSCGCQNGGKCSLAADAPTCMCPAGFTGSRCEQVLCPTRPCPSGKTCIIKSPCPPYERCSEQPTRACVYVGCEDCSNGEECAREASSNRYSCRPVTTRAPPATPRIAPLSSYPKKNDAHVAKPLLGILHFIVVANSFFIFFHVM